MPSWARGIQREVGRRRCCQVVAAFPALRREPSHLERRVGQPSGPSTAGISTSKVRTKPAGDVHDWVDEIQWWFGDPPYSRSSGVDQRLRSSELQ
jgi:hypothetical protein